MVKPIASTSTKRRPLPRGTLSAPRIVGAALTVIDAEGLDGLSMRRLADELGCEAMSLYKHVPDKQTLLDLVVESVLSGFTPPDPNKPWPERLTTISNELRRIALEHPHVIPLVVVRLPVSAVALVPVEATLAALTDAGLDDEAVVTSFWALVAYVTGALTAEAAALTGTVQPFPFAGASPGTRHLANVSRLSGVLAASDYATEYAKGFDLLVGSLAFVRFPGQRPGNRAKRRDNPLTMPT